MKNVTMREKIAKYAIDFRNEMEGKETAEALEGRIDTAFDRMHENYGKVIARLNAGYTTINKTINEKKALSKASYATEIIELESSLTSLSKAIQINKYNKTLLSADKKKMRGSIKELVFVLDLIGSIKDRNMDSITEGLSFNTKEEFINLLVTQELLNVKTFHDEVYTLAELSARTIITELMKVESSFITQYPGMEAEYRRVKGLNGFENTQDAFNFVEVFKNVRPSTVNEEDMEKHDIVNKTLADAVNAIRGVKSLTDSLEQVAGSENSATSELMETIVRTQEATHVSTLKNIIKLVDAVYGKKVTTPELVLGAVCVVYGVFGLDLTPSKVSQLTKIL